MRSNRRVSSVRSTRVAAERFDVVVNAGGCQILNRLLHHGNCLTDIIRLIGHVRRNDDLLFIGNRLSVPAPARPDESADEFLVIAVSNIRCRAVSSARGSRSPCSKSS